MTRCCVPKCNEIGSHHFPRDGKVKKQWLKAIRRPNFVVTKASRLCRFHFLESDYQHRNLNTVLGLQHSHRYLKKAAIPSQFQWNQNTVSEEAKQRDKRMEERNIRKSLFEGASTSKNKADVWSLLPEQDINNVQQEIEVAASGGVPFDVLSMPLLSEQDTHNIQQEIEVTAFEEIPCHFKTNSISDNNNNKSTQTSCINNLFCTNNLLKDNAKVHFYTGLENYHKFSLVLSTLLPMANNLEYRWSKDFNLDVEDQFLMLLIKLRRNYTDYEISNIFNVSKTTVSNIIITWINFVNDLWRVIDIWPSRELVNYYMPDTFRTNFPATRVIVDGTEIPIQKPSQPEAQRATFSSYKHRNTMKILVGSTPGGLLSYCSEAYAGSTSDRQIVERSNLINKCEEGDSVMADRGFNVQDLFASKAIAINIPTFLKGKSQIPSNLTKLDQKLASDRVHIERLIGLTKTYLILKSDLNHFYVPLASKIFFICLMLSNFRECIVNKKN